MIPCLFFHSADIISISFLLPSPPFRFPLEPPKITIVNSQLSLSILLANAGSCHLLLLLLLQKCCQSYGIHFSAICLSCFAMVLKMAKLDLGGLGRSG